MSTVLAVLVRVAVLGIALAAYYAALPHLLPDDGGGANIGAGLIAFGAICLTCLGWAFVDARARRLGPTVVVWLVVGAVFGVLWLVGLAAVEADDSLTFAERLSVDAFLAVFTAGLVALPAAVGAAIGAASRGDRLRGD